MSYVINLDYTLTNFFNQLIPHNIFFDRFFSFFSLKGASILVWILVIVIVLILEERKNPGINKRDKKFIFLFSISFLLTFLLSDFVLKNIFQRPRPFTTIFNDLQLFLTFSCPSDFSFPSAHAATAFVAFGVLAHFDKKRKWFYFIVALLISYSRIYLGCHYFLDVFTGAVLGYIISQLFLSDPDTFPFRKKN
ncbi:MAG: phosphatase PAP2 family protein [Patescibacteria group bacterium]